MNRHLQRSRSRGTTGASSVWPGPTPRRSFELIDFYLTPSCACGRSSIPHFSLLAEQVCTAQPAKHRPTRPRRREPLRSVVASVAVLLYVQLDIPPAIPLG